LAITLNHLDGKTIAVFGLARSGLATVRAALAGGAGQVFAWDDQPASREKAGALGAMIAEPQDWPWQNIASLVLAPGVPLTHPEPHPIVDLAGKAGVEIICDIELLYREMAGKARFVAITGTNGKSTTTALMGHVLQSFGTDTRTGGNIGVAVLDLEPGGDDPVFVIEMSSYQLDLVASFRPNIAIWLNLTPDHLERHGDMAGYARAKQHIFANMTADDLAVVGIDEPDMVQVLAELSGKASHPQITSVSVEQHSDADYFVDSAGRLSAGGGDPVDLSGLASLRGAHNRQNAACVLAAARTLGLDDAAILQAMGSFPGLAHRMEIVGRRDRVVFVNDSKATNADAAARALSTFEPIYWIAGGRSKQGGISSLKGYYPRIAKVYLIGEAAGAFSADLAGQVPHVIAGDMQRAVALAAADAALDERAEPAVLLSPACASFDQYADFEARGDAFRAAFLSMDQDSLTEEIVT
jgi:UDP-N-acetylmuramoylalanine--D-glutamate ligase